MNIYATKLISPLIIMPLILAAGCSDSDNQAAPTMSSEAMNSSSSAMVAMASFRVTLINASSAQILSPAAVILSHDRTNLFHIGMPASPALEKLAEAGMPGDLIATQTDATTFTTEPTPPGMSTSFEITAPADHKLFSLAAMPVYTNDAIAAVHDIAIGHLMAGESMIVTAAVYDAGTEANSESLNTIPGPAIGGEGFNSSREGERDFVAMHPGIVGNTELSTSVLDERYRFSEGSFRVMIERL